ncbi:MAG: IS3 family transposase [Actinomycetota bacterium]|nr:IS3 family transposase [Actinomycetota bacterium]
MTVKYAFICGEEGNYPIDKMCVWAKVSRSGYYEWRGRVPSASELRRRQLSALVAWSFKDSDGTYGYRRVHAHLARLGRHADPETIRLLMRDLGLVACQPRPWRPTTTVAGDAASTPDLVRRDFTWTPRPPSLSGTSRMSGRGKDGYIWRPSWIVTPSRSSGTRWPITYALA